MARRLAAGLIDAAPFALALFLVLPVLVTLGVQAYESLLGVGIFDPMTGGDPIFAAHLVGRRPLAVGAALGGVAWLVVQTAALARDRRSIGSSLAGLTLQRLDGQPASRAQALLREGVRQAGAVALLAVAALAARPAVATGDLPRRYAHVAPAAPALSPLALALPAAVIAAVLAIELLLDVTLALLGKRSLADRLARTRLHR